MGKYSSYDSDDDRRRSRRERGYHRSRSRSRSRGRSPRDKKRDVQHGHGRRSASRRHGSRGRSRSKERRRRSRERHWEKAGRRAARHRSSSKSRRGRSKSRSRSRCRSYTRRSRSASIDRERRRQKETDERREIKTSSKFEEALVQDDSEKNHTGLKNSSTSVPSAEVLAKIESNSFVSEKFVSQRSSKHGNAITVSSEDRSHEDAIFGVTGDAASTNHTSSNIFNEVHHEAKPEGCGVMASLLHEREESKNDRWLKKLHSMRQKRLQRSGY